MKSIATFAIALTFCGAASAQPRTQNARVEPRSAANLDSTFRSIVTNQSTPAWIGYQVAIIPGERNMCCYGSNGAGCMLEIHDGRSFTINSTPAAGGTVHLEGPTLLYVLFRVENKQVGKIRTFSEDCNIDAGNLPFFWLTDIRPEQSIALLSTFVQSAGVDSKEQQRMAESAVAAVAMHREGNVDAALDRWAAPSQPEWLRRKTTFWLGNTRGRHGYETLAKIVESDPSDRVREDAIFGLTQSKEPDAMKAVVRTAREDKSPRVRGQALFWMAQRAQRQIAEAEIARAIENDPDTAVKEKAVFALSQIPHGDGVPKLIEVARNNRNPAVRKKAMFWLGQSKDPRAVAFFEQVLTAR